MPWWVWVVTVIVSALFVVCLFAPYVKGDE